LNLQHPSKGCVSGQAPKHKRTDRRPEGFGIAVFKLQHERIMMEKC
jgi:hypothetical protein